jgi:hypothetical protein
LSILLGVSSTTIEEKIIMKTLITILAFALACSSAFALDIKGLKVDQPVDCVAIKAMEMRSGTFADTCTAGGSPWYTETQFLNGKAMMRLSQSPEKALLSVAIGDYGSFNFNDALDALTVKFGPPTSLEKSTIQNRMGASFDQIEATWVDGDEKIVLSKHGTTINRPFLMYYGKKAGENLERERAEKAKKAAGNL